MAAIVVPLGCLSSRSGRRAGDRVHYRSSGRAVPTLRPAGPRAGRRVAGVRGTVPLLSGAPAGPGRVARPHRHDPRRPRLGTGQTSTPESIYQGLSESKLRQKSALCDLKTADSHCNWRARWLRSPSYALIFGRVRSMSTTAIDFEQLVTALKRHASVAGTREALVALWRVDRPEPPKPGRWRRLADLVNTVPLEGDVILDLRHRIKWGLISPHRSTFGRSLVKSPSQRRALFPNSRRAPLEAAMAGQGVSRMLVLEPHSGETGHDQSTAYPHGGSPRYCEGPQRRPDRGA
jgi:hypothetical protein